jgi:hypothetical protein
MSSSARSRSWGFSTCSPCIAFIRGAADAGRAGTRDSGTRSAVGILRCWAPGTKEVMVSAPLVVLLYDRTFARRQLSARPSGAAPHGVHAALWHRHGCCWPSLSPPRTAGAAPPGSGAGVSWWQLRLDPGPGYSRLHPAQPFWPHPLVFDYGTALARPGPRHAGALRPLGQRALAAATLWALVEAAGRSDSLARAFSRSWRRVPASSRSPPSPWPSTGCTWLSIAGHRDSRGRSRSTGALAGRPFPLCILRFGRTASGWPPARRNRDLFRAEHGNLWGDTVVQVRPDNDACAHVNLGSAYELGEPGPHLAEADRPATRRRCAWIRTTPTCTTTSAACF